MHKLDDHMKSSSGIPAEDIQYIRSQLVNKAMVYFAFLAPVALGISLVRSLEHGWDPIYYIHIFVIVWLLGVVCFRKRLSYTFRTFTILGILLIVGVLGTATFGLVGGGILVLIIFAFMTAIFWGLRAGLIACAINLAIIIVVGIGVCKGIITHSIDIAAYATSLTGWINAGLVFFFYIPAAVLSFGIIHKRLVSSLHERRELFDSTTDVISIHDARTGAILDVNRTMLEMYGYTYDEVLSLSVGDLCSGEPPYTHENAIQQIQKAAQQGRHVIEWQTKKKNGDLCWVEVALSRTQIGGNGRVLAVLRDITERKKTEQEREHLLRTIEAKNKELQSIVYIASHDLKSPLVNIDGFSARLSQICEQISDLLEHPSIDDELKQSLQPLLADGIPESLGFIRSGTSKMSSLLKGLLEISRVGTAGVDIQAINMNRMLNNICRTMNYQIESRNVEVVIDDLPDCNADAMMADQIFSNIIDNALKYMDVSRPPKIHISGCTKGNLSVYCVEDNGVGIDMRYSDKIFEIYHRLDPFGDVQGEGLGLSIVLRMLDRLGGSISVESTPGLGSKFYISLPQVGG